jgi:hypothetical protein
MPMPSMEGEQWWEMMFLLLYNQHGGSGLPITMADLMDMDIAEIFWFLERLNKMREHEAAELRKIK